MQRGLSLPDLLPTLVPIAQSLARVPISNYAVGAVGLGITGRIYLGANLEFPGLPLHHSVHAEQFLITNAANISHLSTDQITHIAVSSVPCGHCRQFLQELRFASDIQILVTDNSTIKMNPSFVSSPSYASLSSLLPQPFGPRDLLHHTTPLLLEAQNNTIILERQQQKYENQPDATLACNGRNGRECDDMLEKEVMSAAERAATKAHAPYSGCPAGFAMGDEEGRIFVGSYAESAAYNPSLGPVQGAMVSFVAGGGGLEYGRIVTAALVERKDGFVSQESTARILLEKVAPNCLLRVYHCTVKISSA